MLFRSHIKLQEAFKVDLEEDISSENNSSGSSDDSNNPHSMMMVEIHKMHLVQTYNAL